MTDVNETGKPVYLIHKALAVFLDILVVVLFIAIGKKEHGTTYDLSAYIQIALPFVASFFAVMLVIAKDLRSIKTAAIASVIAVPLAIILRVSQHQYEFRPAFLIISLIFMTLGWTGWRFILGKLRPGTSS